ncbi:DUF2933 domain-containing protein [Alkalilimnicola ehrlichii]
MCPLLHLFMRRRHEGRKYH